VVAPPAAVRRCVPRAGRNGAAPVRPTVSAVRVAAGIHPGAAGGPIRGSRAGDSATTGRIGSASSRDRAVPSAGASSRSAAGSGVTAAAGASSRGTAGSGVTAAAGASSRGTARSGDAATAGASSSSSRASSSTVSAASALGVGGKGKSNEKRQDDRRSDRESASFQRLVAA